ncbi:MAG: TetR/AcrR family transcriptional regulator [Deltaproteobacteria bacterium]|nr:TetR/AcrR family transcriptional regulator [Deltaproteobacteria bacterium]MBW2284403.1 TetR/AcrR family transcriptional regulator [Deltaproteobacteria bacterium]
MGIKERKKREKDERKASILNAAMQVYAEVGYHATTMEKIAARAELSRATLYLYFKTKDEIFVHAIVSRSDYFGDLLQYIYDHREESKDRIFDAFWKSFRTFYKVDPVSFNATLYFHQGEMLRSLPEDLRLMLDRSGTRNYQLMCRIMEYGIDEGLFMDCDPRTLAETVWTAFLGIIHLENSKAAMSRKNHLEMTWDLAATLLREGMARR